MLELRVIQAEQGDCLILQSGTAANPRHVLIDGGPDGIYAQHLQPELAQLGQAGGKLDLIVLSHVDNDHVIGLLDLFSDLEQQRVNGLPELVRIGGVWHNSFSRTIGAGTNIEPRLRTLLASAGAAAAVMSSTEAAVAGIGEGAALRRMALALALDLNDGFPNDLICVDDAPAPTKIGNLTLRVVGPTRANLDELKTQWLAWLANNEAAIGSRDPQVAANADRSVPNLSSIMLMAEANSKRLLLTGDGRSDHLLQGLGQVGLLDQSGNLHVEVLKVAHHGSDRNATKRFFGTVTADTYVFSANGKDGNPDLATLIWVVEAAQAGRRQIELVLTNDTPSLQKLRQEYPEAQYGYSTRVLPPGDDSITVTIAP